MSSYLPVYVVSRLAQNNVAKYSQAMPPSSNHDALVTEFVRYFPQRAGRFSRVLTRAAHSDFPRGMAQILASVEEGPRTVTQLAEQEGVAQPTVTNIIMRLEKLGLATRRRDLDDGRKVLVDVTPAGRKRLKDMRARHSRALREQLQSLPERELRELVKASDAIQRLIQRLSDETSASGRTPK
jgi:DNA-binding MarR family transcriptional regulator